MIRKTFLTLFWILRKTSLCVRRSLRGIQAVSGRPIEHVFSLQAIRAYILDGLSTPN